jgi:excisionase family DNA binding protein
MTVIMVADYLHVGESKIYELAQKRLIPCNRAAGKWLFPKQLILEWQINESLKYISEDEDEEKK